MRWRKGRIEKLIRGNDSLVRGVELKVNLRNSGQTMTIRRPLQLIIPFELCSCGDKEPANQEAEGQRTKRIAAINADLKRQLHRLLRLNYD